MAERLETSNILWKGQAIVEARKNRDLRCQHGSGPSNIFILDISSSIGDEGVRQMKEAFTTIIDGYALGLPSSRPAISEKAKSVDTSTKPILHVVKGKYFKNSEVVDKLPPEHQKGRPKISLSMNQWFWKDDKGKWNPYSIEMNDRINECYKRDPKSTVVVTIQDQCYRVVMSKSLHINLSTKDVSEVKLVNNGGSF